MAAINPFTGRPFEFEGSEWDDPAMWYGGWGLPSPLGGGPDIPTGDSFFTQSPTGLGGSPMGFFDMVGGFLGGGGGNGLPPVQTSAPGGLSLSNILGSLGGGSLPQQSTQQFGFDITPYLVNGMKAGPGLGIPQTQPTGGLDWTQLLGDLGNLAWPNFPGFGGSGTAGSGSGSSSNSQQNQLLSKLVGSIMNSGPSALGMYGGLKALQNQEWNNNAKIDVLNYLRDLGQGSRDQLSAYNGALVPRLFGFGDAAAARSGSSEDALSALLSQALQNANGTPNIMSANSIPGMSGAYDYLGGLLGTGRSNLGTVSGFANPDNENPMTSVAQRVGIGALLNGGYTPELSSINQIAQGLTGTDPAIGQAQGVAAQILGRNPLLSMEEVTSMARDSSARDSRNKMAAAKRQLLNTTGITGPAIASGGYNSLINDLGDSALAAQADSVNQARLGQQALQSQLFGQGAGLFNSAASQNLARKSQGLESMLGAANAGLNRMNSLGALGLSGTNTDLQRILGGFGLANQMTGTLGNVVGSEMDSFLKAAQLGQSGQQNQNQFTAQLLSLLGDQAGRAGTQFMGTMQMPNQTLQNLWSFLGNIGSNQTSLFNGQPGVQNAFGNMVGNTPWLAGAFNGMVGGRN